MPPNADTERIDLLLALALAFDEARRGAADTSAGDGAEGEDVRGALDALSAMRAAERQALERRAAWYATLAPPRRRDWLAQMLGRAGRRAADSAPLNEHVHPSHVAEALRSEPLRVRELIVDNLPANIAGPAAQELGLSAAGGRGPAPSPEVLDVVRRVFLSRFVSPAELGGATPLDALSGAELARLVRLLGVRETAVACRGIEAVEAVASFLRRFAPEDARAVAAHLARLTDVGPGRVAFAERIVREALIAEPEPGGMLDRVGLRLLAAALSATGGAARLGYTAQKLPLEAARWLREAARAASAPSAAGERELTRAVAREAEAAAASFRDGARSRAGAFVGPTSLEPDAGHAAAVEGSTHA